MRLSDSERLRYARQLTLPEVGEAGQARLKAASVLVVGVGGLGSAAAPCLAAAGVGRIGLIDDDRVSLSNLQRQILYTTSDVGRSKVYAARDRLLALNPEITAITYEDRFSARNAFEVLSGFELVLDCTDGFAARYLVSDACAAVRKPLFHAAISRFDARWSVFASGGPCYRCLYPRPVRGGSCGDEGVLAALPALVGSIQANEALKWILGFGDRSLGRWFVLDALSMSLESFHAARDPSCAACGASPSKLEELSIEETECELPEAVTRLEGGEIVLDLRTEEEFARGRIPGARRVSMDRLAGVLSELALEDRVVFCCRSGKQSLEAASRARESGLRRAAHLEGGMIAWIGARVLTH